MPEASTKPKRKEVCVYSGTTTGSGRSGRKADAYCILTLETKAGWAPITPDDIEFDLYTLYEYAERHPDLLFRLGELGCAPGVGNFKVQEIAPLTVPFLDLDNVVLPQTFLDYIYEYLADELSEIAAEEAIAKEDRENQEVARLAWLHD